MTETETITVCDKCYCASCWQGIFMCQSAQNAGTIEKTRTELESLGLENECYWNPQGGPAMNESDTPDAIAYPTIIDAKKLSALVMCMDSILRHTTIDRLETYEKVKRIVLKQSSDGAVLARTLERRCAELEAALKAK